MKPLEQTSKMQSFRLNSADDENIRRIMENMGLVRKVDALRHALHKVARSVKK